MAEWWQEMFEDSPWQAVQLMWESLEDADQQIEQIVRATGIGSGMRVLDVPCGTGRVAKRLAARGIDVVGVDLTDRFLDDGVFDERGRRRVCQLRFLHGGSAGASEARRPGAKVRQVYLTD